VLSVIAVSLRIRPTFLARGSTVIVMTTVKLQFLMIKNRPLFSRFLKLVKENLGTKTHGDIRHELGNSIRYDSHHSLFFTKDHMHAVEFEYKINGCTFEGRFPMIGAPSQSGRLEKRIEDVIVWSSEIPEAEIRGGIMGELNRNPLMATVFASTNSVFTLVAFYRGIYVYEFNWNSGTLNNAYLFDFYIDVEPLRSDGKK